MKIENRLVHARTKALINITFKSELQLNWIFKLRSCTKAGILIIHNIICQPFQPFIIRRGGKNNIFSRLTTGLGTPFEQILLFALRHNNAVNKTFLPQSTPSFAACRGGKPMPKECHPFLPYSCRKYVAMPVKYQKRSDLQISHLALKLHLCLMQETTKKILCCFSRRVTGSTREYLVEPTKSLCPTTLRKAF